jgi:hypothetical protein
MELFSCLNGLSDTASETSIGGAGIGHTRVNKKKTIAVKKNCLRDDSDLGIVPNHTVRPERHLMG